MKNDQRSEELLFSCAVDTRLMKNCFSWVNDFISAPSSTRRLRVQKLLGLAEAFIIITYFGVYIQTQQPEITPGMCT